MTGKEKKPAAGSQKRAEGTPEGERIAKVLSRRGVASRREAERLIEAGEVKVNGKTVTSPALNVTDRDRITVSGAPLPEREPTRLWLYHKPLGLVTSASDEQGRETVFDALPEDMPRVMSVGRLDLNSEGLLLLTNDGELKRRLELPSTGWLRKYRVRIKGNPADPDLDPLRRGIAVDGETFQPMAVTLDRVQGANAWLTVGLREGKNREIRRAMEAIGLTVNRLIRIGYGPFRLGDLAEGAVEEVRGRVLKDQLGPLHPEAEAGAPEPTGTARRKPAKPGAARTGKPPTSREDAPRRTGGAKPARPAGRTPSDPLGQLSRTFKAATRPRAGTGAEDDRPMPRRSPAGARPPRDDGEAPMSGRRGPGAASPRPARDEDERARPPRKAAPSRTGTPARNADDPAGRPRRTTSPKPATARSDRKPAGKPAGGTAPAPRRPSGPGTTPRPPTGKGGPRRPKG